MDLSFYFNGKKIDLKKLEVFGVFNMDTIQMKIVGDKLEILELKYNAPTKMLFDFKKYRLITSVSFMNNQVPTCNKRKLTLWLDKNPKLKTACNYNGISNLSSVKYIYFIACGESKFLGKEKCFDLLSAYTLVWDKKNIINNCQLR